MKENTINKVVMMTEFLDKSTGELVKCKPLKIKINESGEGKVIGNELFFKLYKDKFHKLSAASVESKYCMLFIEFLLFAMNGYRHQAISISQDSLADMLSVTRPTIKKTIEVCVKFNLVHVVLIGKATYYVVDPGTIWEKAETFKWKGTSAITGDFKNISARVIYKEKDVAKLKFDLEEKRKIL